MLLWVGPHLDRVDDLDQIDAVPLGEQAPLVHERQDRGAIGVLDDLGRLGFDGPIHHGQRELFGIEDFAEEFLDPRARLGVAAGADPPEIADRRNVIAARHHALETVREQRLVFMPRAAKAFFMIGHATNSVVPGATVVSMSVRQCGWTLLADGPHGGFERAHVRFTGPHVAEVVLGVIALHVHDHAIGQLQAIAMVGGRRASFSL